MREKFLVVLVIIIHAFYLFRFIPDGVDNIVLLGSDYWQEGNKRNHFILVMYELISASIVVILLILGLLLLRKGRQAYRFLIVAHLLVLFQVGLAQYLYLRLLLIPSADLFFTLLLAEWPMVVTSMIVVGVLAAAMKRGTNAVKV